MKRPTETGLLRMLGFALLLYGAIAHGDTLRGCTIASAAGDYTGSELASRLAQGAVTLACDSDLAIDDAIAWDANLLTLQAGGSIRVAAALKGSGSARLALLYGQSAPPADNPAGYSVNAPVDLPAGPSFSTTLGDGGVARDYRVITTLGAFADAVSPPAIASLQGMAAGANLNGNFALGADIDASLTATWDSGKGFLPIGNGGDNPNDPNDPTATPFKGRLDGLGHAIVGLTIQRSARERWVGLFGLAGPGAGIRNLTLTDASLSGSSRVGALAGESNGSIERCSASGRLAGANTVGGLVGNNFLGSISHSYADVAVNGSGNSAGGLAGVNVGAIRDSYATGSVQGSNEVGGLVGKNLSPAAGQALIEQCYASGKVSGSTSVGGLVGGNQDGTVQSAYWNKDTSGQATSAGGRPLTSNEMRTQLSFAGFDFTATWIMLDGKTFPMLGSQRSTTIYNAIQLQLMATDPGGHYLLGSDIDAAATALADGVWGRAGFSPVGSVDGKFTGSLDGTGHAISGLTINLPDTDNVGLFGYVGSTARVDSVGLIGASVTGRNSVGALAGYNEGTIDTSYTEGGNVTGVGNASSGSGGLVGSNAGTISGSYTSGSGLGPDGNPLSSDVTGIDDVGGLVGINVGTIVKSYSLANLADASGQVGGLVGTNQANGRITASFAAGVVGSAGVNMEAGGLVGLNEGSIGASNALGRVGCGSDSSCGGLVGNNTGTVGNSYATGGVAGTGENVGGLVGNNVGSSALIENSYATGCVVSQAVTSVAAGLFCARSGGGNVGGLVGSNSGSIGNGYWNSSLISSGIGAGTTTGTDIVAKGLSAAEMLVSGNFTGFSITDPAKGSVWVVVNGDGSLQSGPSDSTAATAPMLAAEYSTVINNAHQLQLMMMNLGGNYRMGAEVEAGGTGYGKEVWGSGGFVPLGNANTPFTGTFDGELHKIGSLTISRTDNNVGLFGYTSGASIRNVGVSAAKVSGANTVGGMIGMMNGGGVSNSYVSAYIYGHYTYTTSKGDNIGGLVGYNSGGTIERSYTSGIVYGGNFVGGLVGQNTGTISNSHSAANANARTGKSQDGKRWGMSGGLVGLNNIGTVDSSYSRGETLERTNAKVGGLIGFNGKRCVNRNSAPFCNQAPFIISCGAWTRCISGPINNSYWDTTTSGRTDSAGGTGLSDARMRQQSSFSGWDFTEVWEMDPSASPYPMLRDMPAGYAP